MPICKESEEEADNEMKTCTENWVSWKPRERKTSGRKEWPAVWEMFIGYRKIKVNWLPGKRNFHNGGNRNRT